jgi:hypothetical protein
MAFVDTMRAEGHAVESICRVLREQGCQIAARTYRAWKNPHRRLAARTFSDARVVDAVRGAAWTTDPDGRRLLTPEGLYGRRKMTAHLRRTPQPRALSSAISSRSANDKYRPDGGLHEYGDIPPASRNHREPATGDAPTVTPASVGNDPLATSSQNARSTERWFPGCPGDRIGVRPVTSRIHSDGLPTTPS